MNEQQKLEELTQGHPHFALVLTKREGKDVKHLTSAQGVTLVDIATAIGVAIQSLADGDRVKMLEMQMAITAATLNDFEKEEVQNDK